MNRNDWTFKIPDGTYSFSTGADPSTLVRVENEVRVNGVLQAKEPKGDEVEWLIRLWALESA